MKKTIWSLVLAVVVSLSAFSFTPSASAASYVDPIQTYTYSEMTTDMKQLAKAYPDLVQYRALGTTKYGRTVWAIKLGKGDATVFYNASHHAREWITTNIAMEMVDAYADAYKKNTTYQGYNVRSLLNDVSIWIVPMVNPDGVTLQQSGLKEFPKSAHSGLIKMNKGSTNFKRWKANAQGIDLNRQYPAGWNEIPRSEAPSPSYQMYKGTKPLEAPEVKLLYNFTSYVDPEVTISYHTSGRILYWHYLNKKENYNRDYAMAKTFSSMTGYPLVKPNDSKKGGGYKDWFITQYGRPAFTPELSYHVGATNPPVSVINEEWKRNRKAALFVANEGKKLWEKKFTKTSKVITTFAPFNLYDRPGSAYKTSTKLKAQKLTVIGTKGNYFRINTKDYGKKWILKDNYVSGTVNDFHTKPKNFLVKESTPLYYSPISTKKSTSNLYPGEVKAIKSYGSYYAVKTKFSYDLWIKKDSKITEFNPAAVNQKIVLKPDATPLYLLPLDSKKTDTNLTPQTVTATKKWNNWFYVEGKDKDKKAVKGWIKQ
ncbi:M14 family metallopeptidase [Fictibacillus sp. S7]|uniref:M14 family metallopeptidase n=1 Tax=Fictibacillus sp. S7 TaxID=2212476 RepID=UPI0013E94C18|nr:M14 family metallocarboxypeptidase [Fictibacillus sp. S7]